ncbi:MAG: cobyric acid synthase [Magnetospiraceae bacterium]
MIQGTGSDVGKSLIVAGLCRAFTRQGLRVAPFKAQNMSNNAAVTPDGGEIGRAQALQARACGRAAHTDMNPVLLKPQADMGAQVVVQGKIWGNATARDYQALKPKILPKVLESFQRLSTDVDILLVEGAGGAAEVNLRAGDIANMGFAEAAGLPVVLVGDVDRGGVLAAIVGTQELLVKGDKDRLSAYIINKFRGDLRLFDPAVEIMTTRTGLPCLGVVPWFDGARLLPAEDAFSLDNRAADRSGGRLVIAVPRLARIANFDDVDPLRAEPEVDLRMIPAGQPLPGDADMVILPGSKATRADLAFFTDQGWDIDLRAHLRRGKRVVGLCGGYQMLGKAVHDPDGMEGPPGTTPGLGLLDLETTLGGDKTLQEVSGTEARSGAVIQGYEMHIGVSDGPARARPWFRLADGRGEGAVSDTGQVCGTYLHGVFASDGFRADFLSTASDTAFDQTVEAALDALAAHLEAHLDLDALHALAR